MTTHLRTGLRLLAFMLAGGGVFAPTSARADALPKFTGYTRIGHPPSDKVEKKGDAKDAKEKPAAARDVKILGVTIYYMVLDRKAGNKGGKGDTWGTGLADFNSTFVAGRNSDPPELDTQARYLYLYQLVNDRPGTESAIKDMSIRLLVDPRLVTSFGWFRHRDGERKADVKGLGFSMEFANPKKDGDRPTLILPVSTLHPGVSDARYLNPAPAVAAPKLYGIVPIAIGKVRDVADDAEVGRAPEDVLLLPAVEFGASNEPDPVYLKPALASDSEKLPGSDDPEARKRMRERYRKTWPALRAYWRDADNQIKPRQRSTVFGFTCDFPPTLDTVAVGGRALGIGWGKLDVPRDDDRVAVDEDGLILAGLGDLAGLLKQRGEAGAAALDISGTLPTPAPPPGGALAQARRPAQLAADDEPGRGGFGGPATNLVGGSGGFGGGTSGGGGGAVAAAAFGGSSDQGSGGGGSGGGNGGGGGTATGGNGGNSGQPGTGTMLTMNNGNVNVASAIQAQAQAQAQGQFQIQAQKQSQSQSDCCPPGDGNVIPAPPAWLLGLLGLPAFWLLGRRKVTTFVEESSRAAEDAAA